MSNKPFQENSGPGSRTRRKMSGEGRQALSKNKCKELIQDMLISNGHREMLKRLVQSRLAQAGWSYAMRLRYVEYIKQKGLENVNVSHMIAETVPKGVETFPDSVKREIEDLLWNFSTEFIAVDDTIVPPIDNDNIGCSDSFAYQGKEAIAEPGIGYNVPSPEISFSRSPSPVSIPRPLTPQPPIPILRPENIKDEPIEDEEEMSSNAEDNDEEEEDEDEDEDEEEEEGEGTEEVVNVNNHNEESEEELMDV